MRWHIIFITRWFFAHIFSFQNHSMFKKTEIDWRCYSFSLYKIHWWYTGIKSSLTLKVLILLHLLKLAEIQYQNVSKCKILHFKDLEFNVLLMFIKIQIWKYKILSIHFWMKSIKLMHIELWIDLSKLFQEEWLQQCKSREIQWGRSYPLLILQLHWYLFDKYLYSKDKKEVFIWN